MSKKGLLALVAGGVAVAVAGVIGLKKNNGSETDCEELECYDTDDVEVVDLEAATENVTE